MTAPASAATEPGAIDDVVAALLRIGTYASVSLLGIGVALMLANGISPLEPVVPGLDLARLPGDLVALRPEGFLWLGLLAVVATPSASVLASLVGFVRNAEPAMAGVSVAILAVIVLSVVLAVLTES